MVLTLVSVLLSHLSLPGNPFPILAAVGLVPLGLAIHGAARAQSTCYCLLFAFLGWFGSTRGLTVGLSSYLQLSGPEAIFYTVVFCAYLSLPYGLFGFLYGTCQWMARPMGVLSTASCLTVLVSFFPSPLPFSLAHSGPAQVLDVDVPRVECIEFVL